MEEDSTVAERSVKVQSEAGRQAAEVLAEAYLRLIPDRQQVRDIRDRVHHAKDRQARARGKVEPPVGQLMTEVCS
jgi:hypothetical protein